jgi:hypothetical protein
MFKGIFMGDKFILTSSLFILTLLFSCSDNFEKTRDAFKIAEEGFVNSNKVIDKSTQTIYASLEDKLVDLVTRYKANEWYPRAMQIQKLSKELIYQIDSSRVYLNENGILSFDEGHKLHAQFKKYRNDLEAVDSAMFKALNQTLIITSVSFDTLPDKSQNLSEFFFDNVPKEQVSFLLRKFENNIRIIENRFAQFCNNKVSNSALIYHTYSVIVAQNTSYLQAGEKLEIIAGVGSFSKAAQPDIRIKGIKIPIDESGAATYKFPVSNKPGKHFIPVEISFTDEEGIKRNETKRIEYTVAPPNNK